MWEEIDPIQSEQTCGKKVTRFGNEQVWEESDLI